MKKKSSIKSPVPEEMVEQGTLIHIVFQHADVAVLKKAMELDERLKGEVMEIKDDFAVGPLEDLDTGEGWDRRVEWWRQLLQASPYSAEVAGSFDDRKTVAALIENLNEDNQAVLWIWMGQNQ